MTTKELFNYQCITQLQAAGQAAKFGIRHRVWRRQVECAKRILVLLQETECIY